MTGRERTRFAHASVNDAAIAANFSSAPDSTSPRGYFAPKLDDPCHADVAQELQEARQSRTSSAGPQNSEAADSETTTTTGNACRMRQFGFIRLRGAATGAESESSSDDQAGAEEVLKVYCCRYEGSAHVR